MKLKDIKIGTQLRAGLLLKLSFVILLGFVAWYQSNKLWDQTEGLYSHPLKVRMAIEELKSDVFLLDRNLNNLAFAGQKEQKKELISAMNELESDAYKQIDSLKLAYLGPMDDITDVSDQLKKLLKTQQYIIELVNAGKIKEAGDVLHNKGTEENQVDSINKAINDINIFSRDRANKFYSDAEATRINIQKLLFLLLVLILVLSALIITILLRGIRIPLEKMLEATEAYGKGRLDARIEYSSGNEFGKLALSFNRLAGANQLDIMNRATVSRIAEVMLKEEDLRKFCHSLLRTLLQSTDSQLGAVYLLNDQKTDFVHFESIGLSPEGSATFSASSFEGEFGLAISSRNIQIIREIPIDTPLLFSTTVGDFKPREIISIPISSGDEVVAMLSLAALNAYSPDSIRIIKDIHLTLTARFNGVLTYQKVLDFTEKLENQNRELDERSRELAIQGNELTEQNLELEMQKNQLDEANRLKSSFLSNMSHELRTPLNSVIALSGVLSRRLKGSVPDNEYGYIEVIERNGKNLLSLINDILDLSRIESGKEEITISRFSANELIDEVVAMIEPNAREKKIELITRISSEVPALMSDYGKCRHIIQNIVGNAVKFTEKGKVEISALKDGNTVRIAVKDTGIGISENDLPNIFDEFRQADEGSSRRFGGTGLGLAIAKKFASLLQGEIKVESRLGKGTTFTVLLPLTLTQTSEWGTEPGASVRKHMSRKIENDLSVSGAGKNILLVEDSEPAIIQILEILNEYEYKVAVARNGKEAIDQIGIHKPDAMILDLMMPEVDGFQVLRMIRESPEMSKLPVLILTAKHITKDELSFLKENNIHQFIQKGDIGRQELLATVAGMVKAGQEIAAERKTMKPRQVKNIKPVVLVVEDNPDNMKTIEALLQPQYEVIEARDGAEGVSMAIKYVPDLVLMDLSLPVMDGFSAFEVIRKTDSLKDIPVIAVTARAMKGSREEILDSGFDDYISKPIDEPRFRRVLEFYLQSSGESNNQPPD